jgi:hypothetical protein
MIINRVDRVKTPTINYIRLEQETNDANIRHFGIEWVIT